MTFPKILLYYSLKVHCAGKPTRLSPAGSVRQIATRQHTKEHDRNPVLKTIFEHESISWAEIARITSLTRTTVSDIVTDLLEEVLVSEIGVGESIGGKSPI